MAGELSAPPSCLPNGPASTRCLGFRRNSCPFEPSLCRLRSPLPGNGISGAEKNAPIRRPTHGSAVSETKRSYKKPANSGPFPTTTGNPPQPPECVVVDAAQIEPVSTECAESVNPE